MYVLSLHSFCDKLNGLGPVNRFNHTSWVAVVTPTNRPKAVRNLCVIEVLVTFLCLSLCFFGFHGDVMAFVIGLNQISSFSHNSRA